MRDVKTHRALIFCDIVLFLKVHGTAVSCYTGKGTESTNKLGLPAGTHENCAARGLRELLNIADHLRLTNLILTSLFQRLQGTTLRGLR